MCKMCKIWKIWKKTTKRRAETGCARPFSTAPRVRFARVGAAQEGCFPARHAARTKIARQMSRQRSERVSAAEITTPRAVTVVAKARPPMRHRRRRLHLPTTTRARAPRRRQTLPTNLNPGKRKAKATQLEQAPRRVRKKAKIALSAHKSEPQSSPPRANRATRTTRPACGRTSRRRSSTG